MAERSIAYANMRRALLGYVRDIPHGQVVEIATLAAALNIPARHAAHILSRLSDDEADMIPWHRVVPRDGVFAGKRTGTSRTARQIALLDDEGVSIDPKGRIDLSRAQFWQPPETHRSTFWADIGEPRSASQETRSDPERAGKR